MSAGRLCRPVPVTRRFQRCRRCAASVVVDHLPALRRTTKRRKVWADTPPALTSARECSPGGGHEERPRRPNAVARPPACPRASSAVPFLVSASCRLPGGPVPSLAVQAGAKSARLVVSLAALSCQRRWGPARYWFVPGITGAGRAPIPRVGPSPRPGRPPSARRPGSPGAVALTFKGVEVLIQPGPIRKTDRAFPLTPV